MRTYSRKPQGPLLIENVQELCRLCLDKVIKPTPIFNDNKTYGLSVPMRIMICLGFEVTDEECFPNIICPQCLRDLNKYYDFKKRCILSYKKLKSHYLAVKNKNIPKTIYNNTKNGLSYDSDTIFNKEIGNVDNEIVLSLANKDALEVISIFHDIEEPIQELQKDEQVQSVATLNNNDSQNYVNSTPAQSVLPIPDDVTNFLSKLLVKLGVLTKVKDDIAVVDPTFKNVQLETRDGSATLELVEVDENPQIMQTQPIQELTDDNNENVDYVMYQADEGIPTGKAVCRTCGKKFSTRTALSRHERIHAGLRPFICDICNRAFTQKEVLRRHMHIHEPDRPFQCKWCNRGFTQQSSFRAHEQTHVPERLLALHRCNICPKMFLHASGLSRHHATHLNRMYKCELCSRTFNDSSSRTRHYKTCKHNKSNLSRKRK